MICCRSDAVPPLAPLLTANTTAAAAPTVWSKGTLAPARAKLCDLSWTSRVSNSP